VSHCRDSCQHPAEDDENKDKERTELLAPHAAFDDRQFLRRLRWTSYAHSNLQPKLPISYALKSPNANAGRPPTAEALMYGVLLQRMIRRASSSNGEAASGSGIAMRGP
jgi:hypothetical protein